MLNFNLYEMLIHGGFTIALLAVCSIIVLKVIIEKWITLYALDEKSLTEITRKVKDYIKEKDFKEALHVCRNSSYKRYFFTIDSPISAIYIYIFQNVRHTKEELLDLAFSEMDRQLIKLEKGVGILGTLGNISPFIGLFGTVLGIIKSFQGLAVTDASNYMLVMSGIADALIATAAGLVVAVPSVIFYNYYMKRIKHNIPAMEKEIKELVYMLKKGE
jgi:biopolymer transport protein ExbB/TolQ